MAGFTEPDPTRYVLSDPALAALPDDELFDPAALAALRDPDAAAASALARAEGAEQGARSIFSFPLLREGACERLVREVEAYEAHCAARGRANRGLLLRTRVVLSDVAPELAELARRIVAAAQPLAAALLPPPPAPARGRRAAAAAATATEGSGWRLAPAHHAYVIRYSAAGPAEGEDRSLRCHTDDSDLTINVCIGREGWRGGALYFCPRPRPPSRPCTPDPAEEERLGALARYAHGVGRAVIHDGAVYHGAEPLEAGARWNLICWCMRDDAPWKREMYASLETYLREKSERAVLEVSAAGGS